MYWRCGTFPKTFKDDEVMHLISSTVCNKFTSPQQLNYCLL